MRTKNSIKNIIVSLSSNIISILVGIVAQAIFIRILGTEYLGLNSLFSNIISMLGIIELGIGSAIIYNLYRPIAENNIPIIKSLMQFYKKSYYIIGGLVLAIGILILPFLPYIVGKMSIDININIIYLLFLIDVVISYFFSYKRSILYANQKNFILNLVHIGYTLIMNSLQLLTLYFTKNYYLYLFIKILMRFIENLIITVIANKMYPFLKDKDATHLDKETEKDIFIKIKALFFHKIGGFVISGTDNIIISKFFSVAVVGLYSNYYLIINSVQIIFSQALQSITASVGNLLVNEDKNKCFETFKRVRFINFWMTCFAGVSILVTIDSFVAVWIGAEYILSFATLVVLILNFYFYSTRSAFLCFKEAAGIFHEDRYVPVLESIINIIASIILLKFFGLAGVFMGTIISGLLLHLYSYPKYVYKRLFDRNYTLYLKEFLSYLIIFLIIGLTTYYLANLINFDNSYLNLLSKMIFSLIIPNIIVLIFFYKTEEMNYLKRLIKKIILRKRENHEII